MFRCIPRPAGRAEPEDAPAGQRFLRRVAQKSAIVVSIITILAAGCGSSPTTTPHHADQAAVFKRCLTSTGQIHLRPGDAVHRTGRVPHDKPVGARYVGVAVDRRGNIMDLWIAATRQQADDARQKLDTLESLRLNRIVYVTHNDGVVVLAVPHDYADFDGDERVHSCAAKVTANSV